MKCWRLGPTGWHSQLQVTGCWEVLPANKSCVPTCGLNERCLCAEAVSAVLQVTDTTNKKKCLSFMHRQDGPQKGRSPV